MAKIRSVQRSKRRSTAQQAILSRLNDRRRLNPSQLNRTLSRHCSSSLQRRISLVPAPIRPKRAVGSLGTSSVTVLPCSTRAAFAAKRDEELLSLRKDLETARYQLKHAEDELTEAREELVDARVCIGTQDLVIDYLDESLELVEQDQDNAGTEFRRQLRNANQRVRRTKAARDLVHGHASQEERDVLVAKVDQLRVEVKTAEDALSVAQAGLSSGASRLTVSELQAHGYAIQAQDAHCRATLAESDAQNARAKEAVACAYAEDIHARLVETQQLFECLLALAQPDAVTKSVSVPMAIAAVSQLTLHQR